MGRHSLPDERGTAAPGPRPQSRGRTVAIATALVLVVAGGAAAAVRTGLLTFNGSCGDDAVRLDVVAAPAVSPALREAADEARDQQITSDGHCIDVRVTARDSYKVATELRSGKGDPEYDVWVPDSDVWVQRVGLGAKQSKISPAGNIASSPVGIGMVPSAAESLGWPRKTYSWPELTTAATKGDKLRLGAADPARSASGLLALAKMGASAKKEGGKEGTTRAAALAKALSTRTTDSDSRLLDTLTRDGSGTEQDNPRRNQALVLSEQAAFAHNASAGEENSLDLFYPKDGSPRLDYPYTLVEDSRMTTDTSRAALRFMTMFSDDDGRRILAEHGFRTDPDQPSDRLVTAAGGRTPQPYAGEATDPPSDKELQETLGMWTITVQSARLSTVVDASESMRQFVPGRNQSRMEVTKASLLRALAGFTDDDEIGLWEFATRLDGARDYRELEPTRRLGDRKGGATHRDELSDAFSNLQPVPGGATGLYDTTLAAYKEARSTYARGRFNALVILTDGANQDPGSISRSSLIAQLEEISDREHPVPIIAIAVGPEADKDEVQQIAEATGGSGHQVDDPAQIHAVILKAIMEAGSNQG
ncbi:substrate-binding and VWA domain-containing protein [Streptomyces sp. Je 1-369]|uniref:substrate-binding and VWA domain-containing protein n=1 Tax=Streptomyces sp. Je 1-369 TaxID=2966192 RepID=UPI002285A197|nr:substrate-binding and VWA domain-containing protein [Streptomyces sp. Je 1-369]WAL94217.1 substrate-binding and VWA domain-containing protein [Streptomyces sp. Je 1-369]